MTGYVDVGRHSFMKDVHTSAGYEILINVVNGGQQTRAIQEAMVSDNEVFKFRSKPEHFPVVTLYTYEGMEDADYYNVSLSLCITKIHN
jgi:hypothetical protein